MGKRAKRKKVVTVRDREYMLKKLRRRLPVFLGLAFTAAVLGTLIGVNIHDEYQTYRSSEVRAYETIAEKRGSYVLITEKRELLGVMYVGFQIEETEGKSVVYRCPDLYRVRDLDSIGWEGESENVVVELREQERVRYAFRRGTWEKE